MSAPNGYPGPQGWPAKAPNSATPEAYDIRQQPPAAPSWPTQPVAAPHGYQPAQQPAAPQGYAPAQATQQGQWSPPAAPGYVAGSPPPPASRTFASYPGQPPLPPGGTSQQPDPYAPQFEPYVPPTLGGRPQPVAAAPQRPASPPYAPYQSLQAAPFPNQQPPAHQAAAYGAAPNAGASIAGGQYPGNPLPGAWPTPPPASRDYDIGAYAAAPQAAPAGYRPERQPAIQGLADRGPKLGDWPQQAPGYTDDRFQQPTTDELGFAQPAGGELDPAFGEEEQDYEYEDEQPRRRPLMAIAALVGAIVVGGGLAYGYKTILGDAGGGQPPTIKSASEPSRTKPADAGGKQFAHSDSKIMGRLGEGTAATAAASAPAAAAVDEGGARKVATLVVGRDGSIQAPPASAVPEISNTGVPGLTLVDALGPQGASPLPDPPAATAPPTPPQVVNAPSVPEPPPAAESKKVVVAPPPSAPQPPPQSTGSVGDDASPPAAAAEAPTKPSKPKKVAALTPAAAQPASAAPATSSGGANGYVAVLASVPASASSRMDALKRFADMQQKYGGLLTGKTPDVAEANLGAKGNYHRLVVGPPASRDQASQLCVKLKAEGYNDCWVTAY